MALNGDDYTNALMKLSPEGRAWNKDPKSSWGKLLNAIAQEFARIDARINDLFQEGFPDTATESITDWERVYGLPDPCAGLGATLDIRRRDLIAKITAIGNPTPQYFIDAAAKLGYAITITEYQPFICGVSRCGDALNDASWAYAWKVNAPSTTPNYFYAESSSAEDYLLSFPTNSRLECFITARKPAHTVLFFGYA